MNSTWIVKEALWKQSSVLEYGSSIIFLICSKLYNLFELLFLEM